MGVSVKVHTMKKNLMIYGSCVSRDAFPLLGSDFKLLSYVARQSMISAISKPTTLLEGSDLASAFQNRSLAGDIRSNLLQMVRRHAADIDVLVIDLTDERLGVIQLPDGAHVTHSHELSSSGRLDGVQGRLRYIDVLTERHWTLWESAARPRHATSSCDTCEATADASRLGRPGDSPSSPRSPLKPSPR